METNNNTIKQENKKALPKFILIMAVCLIGGGALGYAMVALNLEGLQSALDGAGRFFTQKAAAWLLIALPVVTLAVCLPIYLGAKKQLNAWDGEDEAVSSEIENKLSVCIWATGMATILGFFLTAALVSGLLSTEGGLSRLSPAKFFGGLGGFLGMLIVTIVLQQRLVDATKKLYPEKRGSVYDTNFSKKWFASCDEAEKLLIGQCAMKSYQATTYTCMVLWVVFTLGGLFFGWGLLPAMAVCVIWGVNQSVYSYWAIKGQRPGSPSAYVARGDEMNNNDTKPLDIEDNSQNKKEDDGSLGASLGLCFGCAFGLLVQVITGEAMWLPMGVAVGFGLGYAIGSCIGKKGG